MIRICINALVALFQNELGSLIRFWSFAASRNDCRNRLNRRLAKSPLPALIRGAVITVLVLLLVFSVAAGAAATGAAAQAALSAPLSDRIVSLNVGSPPGSVKKYWIASVPGVQQKTIVAVAQFDKGDRPHSQQSNERRYVLIEPAAVKHRETV